MKEKIKYVYNVRRVYNSSTDIEAFNKEVENDGWEVNKVKMINETSSYIIFILRKEKV